MKSEPDVYPIAALERDGETLWDGVRNYQARNLMRDDMKPGEPVLFYHSSASPVGVAGLAEVAGAAVADPTQFDPGSPYHDPKATRDEPRWICVPLRHVETFAELVPLAALRGEGKLAKMALLQRGQRLSVQPVRPAELKRILALAGARRRPTD